MTKTDNCINRQAVVARARSLLGAKWRHRARGNRAVDCVGLILLALRAGGYTGNDRADYGREPWRDGLQIELQTRFGDPIPEAQWQPGDIAVMDLQGHGASHVGILDCVNDQWHLIHSHSFYNVTEHALTGKWRDKLVEVYRVG